MITIGPESLSADSPKKVNSLFIIIGIFGLLFLVASFNLIPNYLRAREGGNFCQCQSNLKNIGTALEMYASDNGGSYPSSLHMLTPKYITEIPTCPGAGTNAHYISSYQVHYNPNTYTFCCQGNSHKAVGVDPDYPKYNTTSGLIAR